MLPQSDNHGSILSKAIEEIDEGIGTDHPGAFVLSNGGSDNGSQGMHGVITNDRWAGLALGGPPGQGDHGFVWSMAKHDKVPEASQEP